MKPTPIALAVALFSAFTVNAHADTGKTSELLPYSQTAVPAAAAAKTREQVQAEYAEAVRTGDIYGPGRGNRKLNEIYPDRYPLKAPAMGKTRDQVRAELAEAQRLGDVDIGEDGLTAAERNPSRYQAARAAAADSQRMQIGMAAPSRIADH